jgi:single-stranded DNA-binding protein
MSLNSVNLIGKITEAGQKLRYRENGSPEVTWTLMIEEPGKGEQTFRLFVPCVAYAKAGEQAESLDGGDLIALQGWLCWRTRAATKVEEAHGLFIHGGLQAEHGNTLRPQKASKRT